MCFGKENLEEIKILLVDDMKVNLDIVENLLIKIGNSETIDFIIGRAKNGNMALEEFKKARNGKEPYHLIFMDLIMPDRDGYHTAKLIHGLEQNTSAKNRVKIVPWTTTNECKETQKKCLSSGMISFLRKPAGKEDVKKVLSDVLGLKLSVSLSPMPILRSISRSTPSSTDEKSHQEEPQIMSPSMTR